MREKTLLPNGCHVGKLTVGPVGWKEARGKVTTDWYISFRFHDPRFTDKYPKGFQVIVKRMNDCKDAGTRRQAIKLIIEDLRGEMKNGFNYITKEVAAPELSDTVDPYTYFLPALQFALKSIRVTKRTRANYTSQLKYIAASIKQLGYATMAISSVEVGHVKHLMERTAKNKDLSNNSYNKYRTCLMGLFTELVQFGATKFNPVREITKRQEIKKIREVLTEEEREAVITFLFKHHYSFWRYTQIFYGCGARSTENMAVKIRDIDIQKQQYKILFQKGKQRIEKMKIIPDNIVFLFKEMMENSKPDDYLFAKGLKPGSSPISPTQINRRWKRLVKGKQFIINGQPVSISKDFYSLKHLRLTKISEHLNEREAAKLAGHTSTAMVVNIYDTKNKERENERLKSFSDTL